MREERYKTRFPGGIFHVYNRGVDGRAIFLDEDDYHFYLERLVPARRDFGVTPLAYCLMPNHVHLLLKQDGDEPISKLIAALHTSYAKRFNSKYRRSGHLFQSRFRQAVVRGDAHLRHLIAYIHLNPVEAGIAQRPEDYSWSSHRSYLGKGSDAIANVSWGLGLFKNLSTYREFMNDTLARPSRKRWKSIAAVALENNITP